MLIIWYIKKIFELPFCSPYFAYRIRKAIKKLLNGLTTIKNNKFFFYFIITHRRSQIEAKIGRRSSLKASHSSITPIFINQLIILYNDCLMCMFVSMYNIDILKRYKYTRTLDFECFILSFNLKLATSQPTRLASKNY